MQRHSSNSNTLAHAGVVPDNLGGGVSWLLQAMVQSNPLIGPPSAMAVMNVINKPMPIRTA
jgi:hypothetical protein